MDILRHAALCFEPDRLLHGRFVEALTEDLPSKEKDLVLLLLVMLGHSAARHIRAVLYV